MRIFFHRSQAPLLNRLVFTSVTPPPLLLPQMMNPSAFVGMPPVDVMARLRYRIEQGNLTMWYDLVRPHKVAEQAFSDAMKIIGSECGTPVLIGGAA